MPIKLVIVGCNGYNMGEAGLSKAHHSTGAVRINEEVQVYKYNVLAPRGSEVQGVPGM